ncbi:hypothetical protein BDW02DRAFT_580853 [Decorospora gaudefroyi]|uniref:Secreted protein n=1 Tax=Decorospora gaudefroyi TaxID=184978 RepID=A0A6A5KD19_9PLEO|nr:hypothetical protein BDW02DRAFT_580853 [Decorospora gaudefroyi]
MGLPSNNPLTLFCSVAATCAIPALVHCDPATGATVGWTQQTPGLRAWVWSLWCSAVRVGLRGSPEGVPPSVRRRELLPIASGAMRADAARRVNTSTAARKQGRAPALSHPSVSGAASRRAATRPRRAP